MLVTDKKELQKYVAGMRIWQGIPSIEVTSKGRIFACWYSGHTDETLGNFCLLVKSDDGGATFSEPIAVAYYGEEHRCFDDELWIDPLGRLWFTWSVRPDHALYGVICENPDAEELVWGDVFKIGNDVMMCKPVVLSSGEWIFPLAVWDTEWLAQDWRHHDAEYGAYAYCTTDQGKTFQRLGAAKMPELKDRSFYEHMIVELKDGRLMMLIRTVLGIGVAYSSDKGQTWTDGEPSGIPGPNSRFVISRLKSGRLMLVNHVNFTGRNNLTVQLSDDDGKTWSKGLLLDERNQVSYPDAKEADDGYIYITYDRERGVAKKSLEEAQADAREILYAKVTEEDILAGKLVSEGSKLKQIINKLGAYTGNAADEKWHK